MLPQDLDIRKINREPVNISRPSRGSSTQGPEIRTEECPGYCDRAKLIPKDVYSHSCVQSKGDIYACIYVCMSTHTQTQPSGEQLRAVRDTQTGQGSFILQKIPLRLSGFP